MKQRKPFCACLLMRIFAVVLFTVSVLLLLPFPSEKYTSSAESNISADDSQITSIPFPEFSPLRVMLHVLNAMAFSA